MMLIDLVPESADPDALYAAFNEWAENQGLTLYPHQDEALIEIVSGANVILSTPTGSGKSLVATAAHFAALAAGGRSFYTAPIKALVSEKFFALCDVFGPVNVGMMTGDGSVNADAPIICCTAEVLANIALRDGADADADLVIMDEFHYYADPERGWAWQVPLIELPRAQFLLISAPLRDATRFEQDLHRRTGPPNAAAQAASDPRGVGINVPIGTGLMTSLSKYDGSGTRLLAAREFHESAGRAGRAGCDDSGMVVVQAPAHAIANERAIAKAGDDPKKRRKVVRKKPPPGMVSWGRPTFDRLVAAEPEPLKSSFAVTHAMLLNLITRPGHCFASMPQLLTDNHEDRPPQRRHIHRAIAIYRALLAVRGLEN